MFGDKSICLYETGDTIFSNGYDPRTGELIETAEWTRVDLSKLDTSKYAPRGSHNGWQAVSFDDWTTMATCQETVHSYIAGESMLSPRQVCNMLISGGDALPLYDLIGTLEAQFAGRWKIHRQDCVALFEDNRDAIMFKLMF